MYGPRDRVCSSGAEKDDEESEFLTELGGVSGHDALDPSN